MDQKIFQNPPAEYRSAPFWAWDGDLQKEELDKQIEDFKVMGYGGFFMHARAGLITPYLSDEYMQRVKDCCEKAKAEGIYAWLYDEDRYPSGPAGGIVTRNPEFTRRYLRFTAYSYDEPVEYTVPQRGFARNPAGELLARYDVVLNADGNLLSYRRLKAGEEGQNVWYAYFEKQPATTDEEQTYVDTLSPEAIQEFARVTYDRYKEVVGEYFGNVSPAMFTDEPQYASESELAYALEKGDVILPWTNGFAAFYQDRYGEELLDVLPELIWNLPEGRVSKTRYQYHDTLSERFAQAFCDTLGQWCEKNGLMFTGHLMGEGTLKGQAAIAGEMMRNYRAFQQPGIDVLGRHKLEFTTAKQCQSAVRQQGSKGMMSELYGVSGWDFDFRGYKLQGDWQAAMGVTLRVPHHALYTFNGESKRDYPASIHYQNAWYKKYHRIEDHFARVNTVLKQGKPVVRIGVIHPIESVWLNMGPNDRSAAVLAQYERNFSQLIQGLSTAFQDFDFISEARLPELCETGAAPLKVGEMAYDVVIVPGLETMRSSTVERLEAFRKAGGRLIFMGSCPAYMDAEPSSRIAELYQQSETMDYNINDLLARLRPMEFLRVNLPSGARAEHLIHQLRQEGDDRWLFLATIRSQPSPDVDIPNQGIKFNVGQKYETEVLRFTLNGEYKLEVWDTQNGTVQPLPARYENGKTVFSRKWYMHDSLLLRLTPGREEGKEAPIVEYDGGRRIFTKVPVSLSEPNVYLMDMAEYALDGEAYRPLEELLKAENICRTECGLPIRKRAMRQPYQTPQVPAEHTIRLRFTIESEIAVEHPTLGMECMDTAKIWLDGKRLDLQPEGWFIDRIIHTASLPALEAGTHVLEAEFPLGLNTKLEYMYLLGDFGVNVVGSIKTITAPVRRLAFGDWVHQGLPFYSGNVTYHLEVESGDNLTLRVPHYRGALVGVTVDGVEQPEIIYSPYVCKVNGLKPGKHQVDLTLYATRYNTLAALHHLSSIPFSQGPDCWRSTNDLWNYEYSFVPQGIMSSPRFY